MWRQTIRLLDETRKYFALIHSRQHYVRAYRYKERASISIYKNRTDSSFRIGLFFFHLAFGRYFRLVIVVFRHTTQAHTSLKSDKTFSLLRCAFWTNSISAWTTKWHKYLSHMCMRTTLAKEVSMKRRIFAETESHERLATWEWKMLSAYV